MLYADLLTAVATTLGSQVTEAQVASLLPIVEARFNRTLNAPAREATAYKTAEATSALPPDCWQVRDVCLTGSRGDVGLEQSSLDSAREIYGTEPGAPAAYVVTGLNIVLFPTPPDDITDTIKIRYQKAIPALSTTQTSNWLLASHPDIYYYSLLLQCEAFIANDERLPIWKAALDEALAELNALLNSQRYGPSPLVRRALKVA